MEAQRKCLKTGTPCSSILQMENFNIKMMQVQGDSAIALVEETDEIEAGGNSLLFCIETYVCVFQMYSLLNNPCASLVLEKISKYVMSCICNDLAMNLAVHVIMLCSFARH